MLRLDNFPNDGAPSQGLNVKRDIELIVGTKYGDMMTGNALRNRFMGDKGPDSLRGRDGNDQISATRATTFSLVTTAVTCSMAGMGEMCALTLLRAQTSPGARYARCRDRPVMRDSTE